MLIGAGIVCGAVLTIVNVVTNIICKHRKFPYFDVETYCNILVYHTFFFSIVIIARLVMVMLDKIIENRRMKRGH
jgi:hypothetical protein